MCALVTGVQTCALPISAELAVARCTEAFGGVDVLVNNAAMRNYSAFADATAKEWQDVVSVNMIGNAGFCRAALPYLRRSGKGSIVTVSSSEERRVGQECVSQCRYRGSPYQ